MSPEQTAPHWVCPVCGSEAVPSRRSTLARCTRCHLVLARDIARPEILEENQEEWFGHSYDVSVDRLAAFLEWVKNRRAATRLRSGAPLRDADLLEVGVGSGGLLKYFGERGAHVVGCDLSHELARNAERRANARVWTCSLKEVPGTYDVIIANHVLEHQPDPMEFLELLRAKLRANGRLLIAVPNVGSLAARFKTWVSYQPYHLLYFDPKTLRSTVERAGFRVVREGTYESLTGWLLLLRNNEGSTSDQVAAPSSVKRWVRLAGVLVGVALTPIRALQGRFGVGDEAYVVVEADQSR